VFQDRFGRAHDDLRISITDRCNLRCTYCMPLEPVWFPREEILSYEEIARLATIAARGGVRKLRITGGEPLLRRDLPQLIDHLARIPGIDDISLTTNGLLLEAMAPTIAAAGLNRVNVSLDTMVPERFRELTMRDALGRVLRGMDAASDAGLTPVKINTVLLRGVNDDEIETLAERARDHGWELRFIEFMPLSNGEIWDTRRVLRGDDVRARIAERWPIEPDPAGDPRAPATRYRYRDGRGYVGFIDSVSRPFCAECSRLRLTADGKLRVCLYDDGEVDLKAALRGGVGDDEIERIIERAVRGKGRGGALEILERKFVRSPERTMHQIGG